MSCDLIPRSMAAVITSWVTFLFLQSVEIKSAEPEPMPTTRPVEDEDELAERLLRLGAGQDPGDIMDRILELMDRSGDRLTTEFDGGDKTQELQKKIVKELDDAIAKAASNRRSKSSSSSEAAGERRSMPKPPDESEKRPGGERSEEAGTEDGSTGVSKEKNERLSGLLRETRRGWGHLPQRDRDEIIQGYDQEYLDKYEERIKRYYRALAETGEE